MPLLDLDRGFAERLDPVVRERARRAIVVPSTHLGAGAVSERDIARAAPEPFAMLVVDGLLIRDVVLRDTISSDLIGPGDLVGLARPGEAVLPTTARLTVTTAARIAVLGEPSVRALSAWPPLIRDVLTRATEQVTREAAQRAISQLPRLEMRLLALFWHLAERWGRVTRDGVVVAIGLTHETLGRLVGGRRPTVSQALKNLAVAGALTRRADGSWLLRHGSQDELAHPAARWRPSRALALGGAAPDDPRPAGDRLADARAEQLDCALWTALHALEDRASRLRHLFAAGGGIGRDGHPHALEREAHEATRQAALIRAAIAPPPVPGQRGDGTAAPVVSGAHGDAKAG